MFRIFVSGTVLIDNFAPEMSCKDGDYSGNGSCYGELFTG
jgi:hypothetical protein